MKSKLFLFKSTLILPIMLFFSSLAVVEAGELEKNKTRVPMLENLASDAKKAREQQIPVLIEFSMHQCPFCFQVEDEILGPMLISGDYDDKVIIRKLLIDDAGDVIDFDGRKIEKDELSSRYGINIVPTLVFFDGYGRPLGIELVGVTTIDFYGAYLDQAIESALDKINAVSPASSVSSAPGPDGAG